MEKHNKYYYDRWRNYPYEKGREVKMSVPDGFKFNTPYSLHELADKAMYGKEAGVFGNYSKLKKQKEMDKPDYKKQPIPSYYIGKTYGYEARKVCEDFELSYNIGNAVTYMLRAGKKKEMGLMDIDKHIEDLQKAINHIGFELDLLNNQKIMAKHHETVKSGTILPDKAPPVPQLDENGECIPCKQKANEDKYIL